MKILVINAGSSSLKYQLFNMTKKEVMAKGLCERIGLNGSQLKHIANSNDEIIIKEEMPTHADSIRMVIEALLNDKYGVIKSMNEIKAVGHRVVHGGEEFSESVIINDDVMDSIRKCIDLAPLHNPANIIGIEACKKAMPDVPMTAVFDTAFHQTLPPYAYLYAIPYQLYEKYKIRKYGFHGTSHRYVSERAAELLNKPIEELNIITCHLGNGSSITAVKGGKSIDTSMGFTPLAGLVMGTRSGMIDPAIVPFLMEQEGLSLKEITNLLNKESGVLGISGVSSDFRDLDDAVNNGNKRAKLALDMFEYSVKKHIGEYTLALGRLDAIVFTAGIGENNVSLRGRVIDGLGLLGIEIDKDKNTIRGKEVDISTDKAKVRTLIIPTNEELMIALDTKKLLFN